MFASRDDRRSDLPLLGVPASTGPCGAEAPWRRRLSVQQAVVLVCCPPFFEASTDRLSFARAHVLPDIAEPAVAGVWANVPTTLMKAIVTVAATLIAFHRGFCPSRRRRKN